MSTTTATPPRSRSILAISSLTLLMLAALAAPVAADSPGNRGSVKIHETPGAAADDRRNEPHVCDFTMSFFGGQPSTAGTWWIESWPASDEAPADFGEYETDENGDAQATPNRRLSNGKYKLFWATSDGHTKHKVFKVSCEETPGEG